MSNQLSMKPSTKPLKGLTVSSNFGSFDTLSATNLKLESINIAGVFEDGVFQNVFIKDSQISNTVIGAEGANVGYFTDLRTNQDVKFISNNFGSYVGWDPTTSIFEINNGTLQVNGCSYLGNIKICQNYIRATNLDGSINIHPNGYGSIYIWGPTYTSTSTGSIYSEITSGGSTLLTKDNIIFYSSEGSSSITTYSNQTFTTNNGDIELITNTTKNVNVSTIETASGTTIVNTYGYHNLKTGDVIQLSSAGNLNGNYTVGTLYTNQKFGLIPNTTTANVITTGNYSKTPNNNIILNTESFVKIPTNTELIFGTTTNSISGNTSSLLISSNGDITLSVPSSNSILIPENTKIQFSSPFNTNGNYTSNGNFINYNSSNLNIQTTNALNIQGPLTQIDSTNTRFYDPILSIADYSLGAPDNKDRGIEFRYYDTVTNTMKLGWFGYKVDSRKFTLIPDAVNINETIYGNPGTFDIGDISTNLLNINSGGTLNLNCGNIINVRNITGCSGTINVDATNSLNITAGSRIALISNGDIYIPNNIPIILGSSGSKIAETTVGNLNISSLNNINFTTVTQGSIILPIQTYLSFDGTSFGSQRISSNTFGDLIIRSNKNVYLTTTSGNLILHQNNNSSSTSSNIQFGNTSELIWGSTSGLNLLTNSSSGTINAIASSNVNISSSIGNILLRTFNGDINLFSTNGNIRLLPTTRLVFDITGTSNSIRYDSTNLVINGGVTSGIDIKNANTINLGASNNINITTGTQLFFSNDFRRFIVSNTGSDFIVSNTITNGSIIFSSGNTTINNGTLGSLNIINQFANISTSTMTITGTSGSAFNINTENVKIQDPILSLANYNVLQNDLKDRGVEYNYRLITSGSLKNGWFGWKNSTSRFTYYSDAINTGEIITGTIGSAEFDSIYLKNTISFSNSGSLDMNCGTISNLNTIIGCSGFVNVIGNNGVNVSSSNINLNGKVQIPYNTPLVFGTTSNSIVCDSSGLLTITSNDGNGTLVLNSNVQINGTTTTIYSTVTNLQDPIFSLGGVTGPISNDMKDRGIEFKWNDGSLTRTGFFGYKNNISRFVFIRSGTNIDEVYSGLYGDVQFGNGYFTNLDLANGTISNVNTISGGRVNIISTSGSIDLSSGNILLPYNSTLSFGVTSNSISSNTNGMLTINSTLGISLNTPTNGSINIQQNVPLYFGQNSFIRQDGNFQIVTSTGNIELYPNISNGNVVIPNNTFLAFGSTDNSVISTGGQLLLNGYNGISMNTTTFTISGNVNILGSIVASGITNNNEPYIYPLGTQSVKNIVTMTNSSTPGNVLLTTNSPTYLNPGDRFQILNTFNNAIDNKTYTVSSIISNTSFITSTGSLSSTITNGSTISVLTTYQGKDVGIQVDRWSSTIGSTQITAGSSGYISGFYGWKDSLQRFVFYSNATIDNNIVTGGILGDLSVNKLFTSRMSGFILDGNVTAGSNAIIGSNFQISGGTINGTPIGVNTAQSGRFTNLSNTVSANFSNVTLSSSLAYTFERYTLSSASLQTRNPSTSFIVSLFSVSGVNYTSSSGTMPSNSANIADGTLKILVCSSMGIGCTHTVFFGANKLIAPNPINSSSQATRITFKRQGQSAQLIFDAQSNNSTGSWILLSNGVYVS